MHCISLSTLTYGHESWVMTERVISQVQAAEMGFLRRGHSVPLFTTIKRSCEIRKALNVKPLLRIERSQLRRFAQVTRMPQN